MPSEFRQVYADIPQISSNDIKSGADIFLDGQTILSSAVNCSLHGTAAIHSSRLHGSERIGKLSGSLIFTSA